MHPHFEVHLSPQNSAGENAYATRTTFMDECPAAAKNVVFDAMAPSSHGREPRFFDDADYQSAAD